MSFFRSFRHFNIYMNQYLAIMFRDVMNVIITLSFPIIAVVITIWVAGENMFVHYEGTKSGFFVLVSAAIWGGLFNSIQTVVKERANVRRDYIDGVSVVPYVMSRAVIQFFLCIFQSAILCVGLYINGIIHDTNFPDEGLLFYNVYIEYFLTFFLIMYAADTMGLCISCIVKNAEVASVMSPYILIVQLIFSGVLFDMEGGADYMSRLMISRWGMEALGSTSDFNKLPLRISIDAPNFPIERDALDMFDYSQMHLITVWAVLAGMALLFIILGNIMLRRVRKE